jgi:simple sugar transport system ATP-binding protein
LGEAIRLPPFNKNKMKVELRDIHKTFGPVYANKGLNLTFNSGKIQGILGENGAGKSTLMKILSGFYQADRGAIYLDDKQAVILSPADAIVHGIGMLHQDPLDFPPMQVLNNFLIGAKGNIFPDRNQAKKDFLIRCREFDFDIDPDNYVDSLTVGERQQLEILRLLWLGAEVLILDEPTTGISAPQKKKLFATLRKLVSEGKTIIFVSHKLEDVGELCDRVAVLRAGLLVGEMDPPFNPDTLISLMFGKLVLKDQRQKIQPGEPVLEMVNINLEDYRLKMKGINVKVCKGEVIGLAGIEGSGQTLFLRACAGLLRPVGGEIFIKKEAMIGKAYRNFLQSGVTYLPASRMEEGLIPGLTLSEHFSLLDDNHSLFIDQKQVLKVCNQRINEYNIHGRDSTKVEMLSGGNQQRALLALLKNSLSLMLLEHPTRGLDVESSIYIWSKLKARCVEGTAIIFISSDLEEILNYSDRILVFFSGQISDPLDASVTSVEDLGELIGGNNWETHPPS